MEQGGGAQATTVQSQTQLYKRQAAENLKYQNQKAEAEKDQEDSDDDDEEGEEEGEDEYYDEMDYGDEMNDGEEKSYRKELIEKRKRERKEAEAFVEPKVLPKRESRGRRMNALVGKAIEEDDAFWNQGLFATGQNEAGSDDDDFASAQESSDQGRDSFDSDFLKGSQSGAES